METRVTETIVNRCNDVDTSSPHWYISYNPQVSAYGSDTTALVIGQGELFIILNGDHIKRIQEWLDFKDPSMSKLNHCLQYFIANKDQLNEFSDPAILCLANHGCGQNEV